MASSATDHKYSLYTLRECTIYRPPYPDWKERNNMPSVRWLKDGSIEAGQRVYSDEEPVEGADGRQWWITTFGFIRGDGLELKYDKAPAPYSPIDEHPDKETFAALALLSEARDKIDMAVRLLIGEK